MTRTIYMKVSCSDCGYQGEMDGRTWSPKSNRCPKCTLGTLERGETVQKRGTTLEAAVADTPLETARHRQAEVVAELPEPPEPVTKRYFGSGRQDVENYVKEGKTLDEITELMKGKLRATSVQIYYGYAIKAPERAQVKHKPESPKPTKLGRPRTGEWVKCAGCGKKIYIKLHRLEGKPASYPFRCGKCLRPDQTGKSVLINRAAFLKYLQALREDFKKARSDEQIIFGINLTIRVLEMMEADVFIMDENNGEG